jgi:leucyl-tRNA synthetase
MNIDVGLEQEEIEPLVMADPKVEKWLEGKTIVKKIFVPDKLLNIVVK